MPSLHEISIPVFIKSFHGIRKMFDKGEEWRKADGKDEDVITNASIGFEMRPFSFQVYMLQWTSYLIGEHVCGVPPPQLDYEYGGHHSMASLYARIDAAIKYLESIPANSTDGVEEKVLGITFRRYGYVNITAIKLLLEFGLPNFYFHHTTIYDLLRGLGVALGKEDYVRDVFRPYPEP